MKLDFDALVGKFDSLCFDRDGITFEDEIYFLSEKTNATMLELSKIRYNEIVKLYVYHLSKESK